MVYYVRLILQAGLDGACRMTAPELGESGDERVRGAAR